MSLIKLRDKLDKVFSLYIRQKYADDNGNVACYTCGKAKHWKELHAGHFVSRRHLCTRFDERNVKPQCPGCNLFNQGNAPIFAQRLLTDYGSKIIDELLEKSKGTCKFTRSDYEDLINQYQIKLKQWN